MNKTVDVTVEATHDDKRIPFCDMPMATLEVNGEPIGDVSASPGGIWVRLKDEDGEIVRMYRIAYGALGTAIVHADDGLRIESNTHLIVTETDE